MRGNRGGRRRAQAATSGMELRVEPVADLVSENERLRQREKELGEEVSRLELQVKDLRHQLWGRKSERCARKADGQAALEFFADPAPKTAGKEAPPPAPRKSSDAPRPTTVRKGPRPLDPELPREEIEVPAPPLEELICPVTSKPMQPGHTEVLEVLARRPAQFYVKRYRRTVFFSPAKSAPVYSPWPEGVLPRSHVDASVVGYVAAAHYGLHLPFHRIEQDLARKGVDLPRSSQVSLMAQLDERVRLLVKAVRADVLASGYVRLDATVVKVQDPQRPGKLRDACVWAYRGANGSVFFDYQATKAIKAPDTLLKAACYSGFLQTDAAEGLDAIGPPGKVTHLGCHAHLRRPFFKALTLQAGDSRARSYLDAINRLFRIDRLAAHFRLSLPNKRRLREKHSLPLFDALVSRARDESAGVPPSLHTGDGMRYLLNRHDSLRRCLSEPQAELSNNPCEAALRPIKIGANNWGAVGHPQAGDRLANLFTLVENCRSARIDPEAYLIDIIARLLDHSSSELAQLLPRNWKPAATSGVASSG